MVFPFWKYSLNDPKIMFKNIINNKAKTFKDGETNVVVVIIYPDDYMQRDHITNHFIENVRINCKFGNSPTPSEVYRKVKDSDEFKNYNKLDQREFIYNKTRECNTFNDSYCSYIINSLVGKNAKILDPSIGFLNRLTASLANCAELYHGWDPNIDLKPGFIELMKTLNPKNKTEVKIEWEPFEDSNPEMEFYDLAITSPPYYDIEKYSKDESQSTIRYKDYDTWLDNFLKPYLTKMITSVKVNGFIAIYIENITNYPLRDFTTTFINSTGMCKFHSKIGMKVVDSKNKDNFVNDKGRIRYTLVWQRFI